MFIIQSATYGTAFHNSNCYTSIPNSNCYTSIPNSNCNTVSGLNIPYAIQCDNCGAPDQKVGGKCFYCKTNIIYTNKTKYFGPII